MQIVRMFPQEAVGKNRSHLLPDSLEPSSQQQSGQARWQRCCGQLDNFPDRVQNANSVGQEARALEVSSNNMAVIDLKPARDVEYPEQSLQQCNQGARLSERKPLTKRWIKI